MSGEDPQMKIRLTDELMLRLEEACAASNRTLNAEVVTRLARSFLSEAVPPLHALQTEMRAAFARSTELELRLDLATARLDNAWLRLAAVRSAIEEVTLRPRTQNDPAFIALKEREQQTLLAIAQNILADKERLQQEKTAQREQAVTFSQLVAQLTAELSGFVPDENVPTTVS